jgi:hypothetical protein
VWGAFALALTLIRRRRSRNGVEVSR